MDVSKGSMDPWMSEFLSNQADRVRPGDPFKAQPTKSAVFSGERLGNALGTKPTPPKLLWSKPPGDPDGKAPENSAQHSEPHVALIHEKGGTLSYKCSEKKGVKSYQFFFTGNDKKAGRHSADISVATHPVRPEVAVIRMNKMHPDGVPDRAGSAMLLTVLGKLTSDVHSICIDRLPKPFQATLNAECAPQKTQDGHVVNRAQFGDFLAGRLARV